MARQTVQGSSTPVEENLDRIKRELPEGVELVVVTKTHPPETIMQAYRAGHKVFGENKAQELEEKYETLPKDIEWHFIGHLQTNKVKAIAPFVHRIHSVDRLKLLKEIDKRARQNQRTIDVLIQLNISGEESKFGLSFEQGRALLHPGRLEAFEHIRACGVMGMAEHSDDETKIRDQFKRLKAFFDEMKTSHCKDKPHFREVSMGMTHDYRIAIDEGTTMVRVGSAIFGARN